MKKWHVVVGAIGIYLAYTMGFWWAEKALGLAWWPDLPVSVPLSGVLGWNVSKQLRRIDGHRQGQERDSGGTRSGPGSSYHAHYGTPARTNPESIGEPGEGTDPELVVPDLSEAIVGYRSWVAEFGILKGYGDKWWPHGEKLVAKHETFYGYGMYGYQEPKCKAPKQGCDCGIYAYNEPQAMGGVFGEVNLWGRVLQGEKGYRAEFAYPKRLWVTQPSFKPVQTALDCVRDAPDEVKREMTIKANGVKRTYAKQYYETRLLADQLRDNYKVSVELHDPDGEHPFGDVKKPSRYPTAGQIQARLQVMQKLMRSSI